MNTPIIRPSLIYLINLCDNFQNCIVYSYACNGICSSC